jgi:hypothetical protein
LEQILLVRRLRRRCTYLAPSITLLITCESHC